MRRLGKWACLALLELTPLSSIEIAPRPPCHTSHIWMTSPFCFAASLSEASYLYCREHRDSSVSEFPMAASQLSMMRNIEEHPGAAGVKRSCGWSPPGCGILLALLQGCSPFTDTKIVSQEREIWSPKNNVISSKCPSTRGSSNYTVD